MRCTKCTPFFFKHEDGWDVFRKADTELDWDVRVPSDFGAQIIEDAPTRKIAKELYEEQMRSAHFFGMCLMS